VKYISVNRANEFVKYDKTMAYINDLNINTNDMAAVDDINEVDLLNNLKNRFLQKSIFTNVGQTLIIVNPYQKIDGAFGEDVIKNFLNVI
jgi:myosin heavy subunit